MFPDTKGHFQIMTQNKRKRMAQNSVNSYQEKIFFTADMLTFQGWKSTGVTNNMNVVPVWR